MCDGRHGLDGFNIVGNCIPGDNGRYVIRRV